jgi:O-antigen/teichoic acid export membrane protein
MFRSFGIGPAIVYQKSDIQKTLNTAFIMESIIGLILFLLILIFSPLFATFFDEKALINVFRVLGLTVLLHAFTTAPGMLLEKELKFRARVIPEIVSSIVYSITAIVLAISGLGFWSIIFGSVVSAFSGLVTTWIVFPGSLKIEFDKSIAKDLLNYGKHVLSISIISFLILNLDYIAISKIVGNEMLGFYFLAYNITNFQSNTLGRIFNRVFFPIFSNVRNDREMLKRLYFGAFKYISMVVIPFSFILLVMAREITTLVYGGKWIPMIGVIQILSFYGLFRTLGSFSGIFFLATGEPKVVNKNIIIQLILVSIIIFPATMYYNLIGTALIVTFSIVVTSILLIALSAKRLSQSITEIIDTLNPILVSTFILVIVLLAVKKFVSLTLLTLLLVLIFSIILYIMLLIVISSGEIFNEIGVMFKLFTKEVNED